MSGIIHAVNFKLKATSDITDVVSTRIWYKVLPQNPTYPALTFQEIDDLRYQTHDLYVGPARARIQFDVWTESKSESETLIEAVIDTFAPYRGSVALTGTSPLETVYIDAAIFEGMTEIPFEYESETILQELFRKSADFTFWYR